MSYPISIYLLHQDMFPFLKSNVLCVDSAVLDCGVDIGASSLPKG